VNDQFQVTDWAFATPPRASRDVNAIVFANKCISNSLQVAIGGFDSASALVALVSNWVDHFRCYKAELRSASTIPVRYVQWRHCDGIPQSRTAINGPAGAPRLHVYIATKENVMYFTGTADESSIPALTK
jgi:hypothetical protein